MSDARRIVLTDEPDAPDTATERPAACAGCGAPRSQAVIVSEFGGYRRTACGQCAHDYPPEKI